MMHRNERMRRKIIVNYQRNYKQFSLQNMNTTKKNQTRTKKKGTHSAQTLNNI